MLNRSSTRKLAEEQEKLRNGLSKLLTVIDPLEAKLNKLAFGQAVDQTVSEFVRLGEAPST